MENAPEQFPEDDPYDHCSNPGFDTAVPPTPTPPPPVAMPQFAFTAQKAGMEQVDKERVNRIIEQASLGNPYYEKAKRDDLQTRERAQELKLKAQQLTGKDLSVAQHVVNKRVLELEPLAVTNRVFVMVDMDQFYVGVEMRDHPELMNKPVAVGKRLISTANYVARRFGVRSAMPEFIARRLCPELICVDHRMDAYIEASRMARKVFAKYDCRFQSLGLDEALLDLTGREELHGLTLQTDEGVRLCAELVQQIRRQVFDQTGGLTCSAGVACTPALAKICSEANKPDGQYVLPSRTRKELLDFVHALPVRKIPGIGKTSEIQLQVGFDVQTVGDLWDKRLVLNRLLTPCITDFYLRVTLAVPSIIGEDEGEESEQSSRKSISFERTFKATAEEQELKDKLLQVCTGLAKDIASRNGEREIHGRTLTLKLKSSVFEIKTRSISNKSLIGGSELTGSLVYDLVEPLLLAELPICARLIGVRLSNLQSDNYHHQSPVGTTTLDRYLVVDDHQDNGDNDNKAVEHCPVCSTALSNLSNDKLNAHIDSCLNSSLLTELTSHPTTTANVAKKTKTLDEYFKS
ncbi:hypothetical protein BASA81_001898 [Batrachochytrium salamandrivorans]|nr:hypothetical protein BASA81_001898 [Batrachochytrium salamandrivorans]